MIQISLYIIILIISVLIGIITLKKSSPLYLKQFPFFLLIILIIELIGQLNQKRGNNVLLYNLTSIGEFCFYSFYFTQTILGKKIKKEISLFIYLFTFFSFSNLFFFQGYYSFNTYTYSIGCISIVILSSLYYYQLFKSSDNIDLLHEPSFWITTGLIFYYISSITIFGMLNYISILPKVIRNNLQQITLLINAFFYSLFIIAFLCKYNIRKLFFN
jgi:hypothetical protein